MRVKEENFITKNKQTRTHFSSHLSSSGGTAAVCQAGGVVRGQEANLQVLPPWLLWPPHNPCPPAPPPLPLGLSLLRFLRYQLLTFHGPLPSTYNGFCWNAGHPGTAPPLQYPVTESFLYLTLHLPLTPQPTATWLPSPPLTGMVLPKVTLTPDG